MRRLLPWHAWNPGLDNGHRSPREVLATLPGLAAASVPWLIRLLENPESPVALPGAITLARHDTLHVLLGRGLSNQDEAFVIGYTMGAAKTLRRWQRQLFRWVASRLYPGVYRWSATDLIAFDLGYAHGLRSSARDLHAFPFENHLDRPVDELRRELGIDILSLHSVYREERLRIPDTPASRRLDVDYGGIDPSDIMRPEGGDSGWKKA